MIGYQGLTLLEQSMLYQARLVSLLPDRFNLGGLIRQNHPAQRWINVEVGNGRNTRFWTDNWSPFGRLNLFLNLRSSTLGTRPNSMISDLCNDGVWSLPSPRSEDQLALHAYLTIVTLTDSEETVVWSPLGKVTDRYSTCMIYKLIRDHKPVVPWSPAVWIARGIPKHNFLTWLVNLNR